VKGDDIRGKEFRQALRGYHIDDVDRFLDQLAHELDAGHPTRALIHQAKFRQTLRGYRREDVDRFLGEMIGPVVGVQRESKPPGLTSRRNTRRSSQPRPTRSVEAERSGDSPATRGAFAPARHLAIVTCMDPRLNPLVILRVAEGDAHVIRNAGGICTADVIRSLSISQRVAGTRDIIVIQHTDCALLKLNDTAFRDQIQRDTGEEPPWEAGAFSDLTESVRRSMSIIKASAFIPSTDTLRGFIYDVFTDKLDEVSPERHDGGSRPEHHGGSLYGGWWSVRKG
jgi:carbonic anhydrase